MERLLIRMAMICTRQGPHYENQLTHNIGENAGTIKGSLILAQVSGLRKTFTWVGKIQP